MPFGALICRCRIESCPLCSYIFETQLVKTLVYKFLPTPAFRNDVLACLTEVGSLDIGTIYESLTGEIGAAYDSHFEVTTPFARAAIHVACA